MKAYNLYYKNSKINKKPIFDSEIRDKISKKEYIIKMLDNNKSIKIPTNEIQIIKCTIL